MGANAISRKISNGCSIITCTKRASYIYNLFNNYNEQKLINKELIIILNNDDMSIQKYRIMAKKYDNVSVYQLPEKTSLGRCLNFGIRKSRFNHIAKFDDDDYYAPDYLTDAMRVFQRTNADVVGHRAHFMWLDQAKLLLLRFYNEESKVVRVLAGATLVFKRKVFNKVRFSNLNIAEDQKFCRDCKATGFKLFSTWRYNFVAIRRKHSKNHTWIISDRKLLTRKHTIVLRVKNYKEYITRTRQPQTKLPEIYENDLLQLTPKYHFWYTAPPYFTEWKRYCSSNSGSSADGHKSGNCVILQYQKGRRVAIKTQ